MQILSRSQQNFVWAEIREKITQKIITFSGKHLTVCNDDNSIWKIEIGSPNKENIIINYRIFGENTD